MSRENVEVVRQGFAAYAKGGVEALLPLYSDAVVLHSIPEWPDDPEYHGHDGVRKLTQQWTENFEEFGFELHELRDAGDTVVALTTMTGRIRGSSITITHEIGHVCSGFEGGQVGQIRYFSTWAAALEAIGQSE